MNLFGNPDDKAKIAALDRAQAVIEFGLDGTILTANRNFLDTMGYTLDEIRGKHHSMFVDPDERASEQYRTFWAELNRGSSRKPNICASPRAGAKSGSGRRTTRCWTRTGSPTGSSSSRPT
jgi:PAS domain-containing protein